MRKTVQYLTAEGACKLWLTRGLPSDTAVDSKVRVALLVVEVVDNLVLRVTDGAAWVITLGMVVGVSLRASLFVMGLL